MKQLPIGKGFYALVDDEDYEELKKFRWNVQVQQSKTSNKPYYRVSTTVSLARFLIRPPLHLWVDHINGNPLDNQRHNLRPATPTENSRNTRRAKLPSSGFRGVTEMRKGKFKASICMDGQYIDLGTFASAAEAAQAYDNGARLYHGEFASLNSLGSQEFQPHPEMIRTGEKWVWPRKMKQGRVTIFKRYEGPDAVYYYKFKNLGRQYMVSLFANPFDSFRKVFEFKEIIQRAHCDEVLKKLGLKKIELAAAPVSDSVSTPPLRVQYVMRQGRRLNKTKLS